jgi:zinc-ribbon domain
MTDSVCPECGTERKDFTRVCPACGAPPVDQRSGPMRAAPSVRTADLEPYVALRYIAKLFKVLAALIMIMLLGEVVLGLVIDGRASVTTLLGEATRLLVLAGMLWAAGDIAVLMVDAGHDLRLARILLGRINAQMHRRDEPEEEAAPRPRPTRVP